MDIGTEIDIDPSCKTTDSQCYTELDREEAHKFFFRVLYLNEIPGAMDKMGWPVAAKMMRQWFSNPQWEMPDAERDGKFDCKKWEQEHPAQINEITKVEKLGNIDYEKLAKKYPARINDSIIKMQWALDYPPVESVFNDFIETWDTPKGIATLWDRLRSDGWKPGKPSHQFGDQSQPAKVQDTKYQINYREIGSIWDTFDDFFGAINKATLKITVTGEAFCHNGRDFFRPDKIGVYLRDTYDFNSGWWTDHTIGLGVWSKDRVLPPLESAGFLEMKLVALTSPVVYLLFLKKYGGFVHVENKDFYRWAEKHGTGGDFYVFSDVFWTESSLSGKAIELRPPSAAKLNASCE